MGKKKQVCFRIEEEVLKEFKKWLIDKGYRSINQYLNEHIYEVLEKEGRLPFSSLHHRYKVSKR